MKTSTRLRVALFSLLHLAAATSTFAQGSVNPSGSPGPTGKSLQEIWDKIGGLEIKAKSLEDTIFGQQKIIGSLVNDIAANQNIALPWKITTVDYTGIMACTSLAFTPAGQPAIGYYNANSGTIRYAVFDGTMWSVEIASDVDISTNNCSLAFSPDGLPAISHDGLGSSGPRLNYAVRISGSWDSTHVDFGGPGAFNSLAFLPDARAVISYYANSDLMYALKNGNSWTIEPVDSTGIVGKYNSIAIKPGGRPAISYYDETNERLKYAEHDGNSWIRTAVTIPEPAGAYTSLAFTPDGRPAISCAGAASLKYVERSGASWSVATPEVSAGTESFETSLAFTPTGQPAIAYFHPGLQELRYAVFNGTVWKLSTVDTDGAVGYSPSLAFTPGGQPAISYFDKSTGVLKYAERKPFGAP